MTIENDTNTAKSKLLADDASCIWQKTYHLNFEWKTIISSKQFEDDRGIKQHATGKIVSTAFISEPNINLGCTDGLTMSLPNNSGRSGGHNCALFNSN